MPNINSAIKRVKTTEKANLANNSKKSAMRRSIRRFEEAAASGDDKAQELFKAAQKAIDSAASKGLIHSNKAARDKSRLAAKLAK